MGLKQLAKKVREGDYIPGGERVRSMDDFEFRETTDDEVFRCGTSICSDPQSGPIFCGDVADYIGIHKGDPNKAVALCRRHTPHDIRKRVAEAAEQPAD